MRTDPSSEEQQLTGIELAAWHGMLAAHAALIRELDGQPRTGWAYPSSMS